MSKKAIIKVLCCLAGLMLLTIWLAVDGAFVHETTVLKTRVGSSMTVHEACTSALWRLRCDREASTYATPLRTVVRTEPSAESTTVKI